MPANERDWFPHIDPLTGERTARQSDEAKPQPTTATATATKPRSLGKAVGQRVPRLGKVLTAPHRGIRVVGLMALMVGLGALVGTQYQQPPNPVTDSSSSSSTSKFIQQGFVNCRMPSSYIGAAPSKSECIGEGGTVVGPYDPNKLG